MEIIKKYVVDKEIKRVKKLIHKRKQKLEIISISL